MTKKRISIIIPLYNLEELIGKCIHSTLVQNLPADEYEVLVVDDGSTDGSLTAAKRAAQGYPNVRIFTKSNEGLSYTRNFGTDRAEGKYIMYLDADDYLEPNILMQLDEAMEREKLDMVCIEVVGIDEKSGADLPLLYGGISEQNGRGVQRGIDIIKRESFLCMVYAYIYKRDFLNNNKLRMMPIWHEDEEFTPRALYFAKRFQYLPIRVYNYLQRSNSFTNNYDPKRRLDFVKGMISLNNFAKDVERADPEGAKIVQLHIARILSFACEQTILTGSGDIREMLRSARRGGVFPLEFTQYKFRHFLINHLPQLYIAYVRWRNNRQKKTLKNE